MRMSKSKRKHLGLFICVRQQEKSFSFRQFFYFLFFHFHISFFLVGGQRRGGGKRKSKKIEPIFNFFFLRRQDLVAYIHSFILKT